jgi:hypothetical protein
MILHRTDIGRYAIFSPLVGPEQRGRIKMYDNQHQVAWVVYDCNGEWHRFDEFPATATSYDRLTLTDD